MLLSLSKALMLWLVIGLLTGIKLIFVDEVLSKENLEKSKDRITYNDSHLFLTSRKSIFLSVCTLMGFLTLYYDIQGLVSRKRR